MVTPIIICGQQRSGTTALQSYLSHVDGVKSLGEIFKTADFDIQQPQNYYYYLKNYLDSKIMLLSDNDAEEQLERYMAYLSSLCPGTYCAIDIKYDFWHNFSPGWFNLMDPPFMLRYFKKMNFPIIHVIRGDPFSQYLSHLYALATNRWHYRTDAPKEDLIEITVNCVELAYYFKRIERNIAHFRECLAGYPQAVELTYESLFNGTQLDEEAQQKLLSILPGWVVKHGQSKYIKPKIDIASRVSNKAEVIQYFFHTRHRARILDALGPLHPEESNKTDEV